MINVYDRNHEYLRSGDEIEIAGFEIELLTDAETANYGEIEAYNDPMLRGEEREVIWVSENGDRTLVGYVEYLGEEAEIED